MPKKSKLMPLFGFTDFRGFFHGDIPQSPLSAGCAENMQFEFAAHQKRSAARSADGVVGMRGQDHNFSHLLESFSKLESGKSVFKWKSLVFRMAGSPSCAAGEGRPVSAARPGQ